jgi:Anti-sigma factor NepR
VSTVRGNRLVQSEKATSAREIQRLIGEKLKAQYDLAEPIPDRLVELLKQLAQLKLLNELTQLMDEPDSKRGKS